MAKARTKKAKAIKEATAWAGVVNGRIHAPPTSMDGAWDQRAKVLYARKSDAAQVYERVVRVRIVHIKPTKPKARR